MKILLDESRWVQRSILPWKYISHFADPHLSIDSIEYLCDFQVWALDLVTFQFFCHIPKWKINIILGSIPKSCQTIKAQYKEHSRYPDHPTKSDLWRKIDAGICDVTRL